jgi:mitochondrial fission protein ELM1
MAVAAGSGTYYALKVLSAKSGVRTVSMMYPRGYRPNFDVVFVQSHDSRAACGIEAVEIPVNFSYPERQGLYKAKKKAVAVVIGGSNSRLAMPAHLIRSTLDAVFDRYRGYETVLSTSPRTPREIEEVIDEYTFDYKVIYSENPVNPIPDFLYECETVFITEDSTSMISEAVSSGRCCVEVIPLESNGPSKFSRLSDMLERGEYLHRFDGNTKCAKRKVNLSSYAKKAFG